METIRLSDMGQVSNHFVLSYGVGKLKGIDEMFHRICVVLQCNGKINSGRGKVELPPALYLF